MVLVIEEKFDMKRWTKNKSTHGTEVCFKLNLSILFLFKWIQIKSI